MVRAQIFTRLSLVVLFGAIDSSSVTRAESVTIPLLERWRPDLDDLAVAQYHADPVEGRVSDLHGVQQVACAIAFAGGCQRAKRGDDFELAHAGPELFPLGGVEPAAGVGHGRWRRGLAPIGC